MNTIHLIRYWKLIVIWYEKKNQKIIDVIGQFIEPKEVLIFNLCHFNKVYESWRHCCVRRTEFSQSNKFWTHMFQCRYEIKLFCSKIYTSKMSLDVYKYKCFKWFIGIISVPIVMPSDLFWNSSLYFMICNFSIGYILSDKPFFMIL